MASWDFGGGGSSGSGNGSWGDFSAPPSTAPSTTQSLDGQRGAVPVEGQSTSAATLWLIAGSVLAVSAIVVAVLADSVWSSFGAWFLGGPVAIGLLSVFIRADTRRRADPWYVASPMSDWGRRVLVLLSLIAVGVSAWNIADFFARGGF